MSIDTPDYLPQNRLGSGYIAFNQIATIPAHSSVVTTPLACGTFGSMWVQVLQDGNWSGSFGAVFSDTPTKTNTFSGDAVEKTTQIATIVEVPVLGQYGFLVITNKDSAQHQVTYSLFGANGSAPPERLFLTTPAIDEQGVSIAAGTTQTFQPSFMVQGHYKVWTDSTQAGVLLAQCWTGNSWDNIWGVAEAVSPGVTFDLVVPQSDWQFTISNPGGSTATASLAVTGPY